MKLDKVNPVLLLNEKTTLKKHNKTYLRTQSSVSISSIAEALISSIEGHEASQLLKPDGFLEGFFEGFFDFEDFFLEGFFPFIFFTTCEQFY